MTDTQLKISLNEKENLLIYMTTECRRRGTSEGES